MDDVILAHKPRQLNVAVQLMEAQPTCSLGAAQGCLSERLIAKFHYTGPTGPDQTKSAYFVGESGLRPGSREKVRAGPVGPM